MWLGGLIMADERDAAFEALLIQALDGKHSDFEFVRNLTGLRILNVYIRGMRKIVRSFKETQNAIVSVYLSQVEKGIQDIGVIMAIKQFGVCTEYYQKELEIAKDMRKEYRTYVMSGHILDTLLGYTRPDNELVDYRKLPFKLF